MHLVDFSFVLLSENINLNTFDCGDDDINEFLKHDSLHYQKQKLANTYLFLDNDENVAAFFCISNDCLNDLGVDKGYNNSIWNRFHRKSKIPNNKRIRQYPSIKIGRLGISKTLQRTGFSYELMDFIKGFSIYDHKPAVRLLLLDAYNQEKQLKYYTNNGFIFLLDTDLNDKTRLMFYDLLQLA